MKGAFLPTNEFYQLFVQASNFYFSTNYTTYRKSFWSIIFSTYQLTIEVALISKWLCEQIIRLPKDFKMKNGSCFVLFNVCVGKATGSGLMVRDLGSIHKIIDSNLSATNIQKVCEESTNEWLVVDSCC